ncbi:MAG: response regulator transcription factor [Magnetococcus sp. MYC-9]
MVKIFITDDHPLLRAGVKAMLVEEKDFLLVGESGTGKETMQRLRKEAVDVLLLDFHLPDLDGFEVLQRVRELRPELKVLILTSCAEESMAYRFLRAGASGYLVKDMLPEELVKAVRIVIRGRRYLAAEMAAQMADRIVDPDDTPLHEKLTNREFQVFNLLVAGTPGTEIARVLRLAPSTVSTYRTRILEKLELASVPALIRYALDHKLVE